MIESIYKFSGDVGKIFNSNNKFLSRNILYNFKAVGVWNLLGDGKM
jgi:hypothetical protein